VVIGISFSRDPTSIFLLFGPCSRLDLFITREREFGNVATSANGETTAGNCGTPGTGGRYPRGGFVTLSIVANNRAHVYLVRETSMGNRCTPVPSHCVVVLSSRAHCLHSFVVLSSSLSLLLSFVVVVVEFALRRIPFARQRPPSGPRPRGPARALNADADDLMSRQRRYGAKTKNATKSCR